MILSFTLLNNRLVEELEEQSPSKNVLILTPHCLQNSSCSHRVVSTLNTCKRCGKCGIGDLADLADETDAVFAVATGGRMARRILEEHNTELIFAIACEDDLSSGIVDSYPLRVYGVINIRPHGPCKDTCVDMDQLSNTVRRLNKARHSSKNLQERINNE